MLIKEFEKKYKEVQNVETKETLIKGIIKRTYAPVLEKKLILDTQFDKCVLMKDGVLYIDNFLEKVNLVFSVISLYTNLDVLHTNEPEEERTSLFDDYDLLMSSGIFDLILVQIGEREIKELMSIKSSVEETFRNKQTTESYIAKQVTRFAEVFGAATDSGLRQLSEVANDDSKMKEFAKKAKNIVDNITKSKK